MFRPVSRCITRPTALRAIPRAAAQGRRFLTTAPPSQVSRSWKNKVARLGVAGAIIYYYNTTDVFAEEPQHSVQLLPNTDDSSEQLPTIEALAQERQRRKAEAVAAQEKEEASTKQTIGGSEAAAAPAGSVEELEEEAGQQGAFNPETGEINWDCPCLGGMADGPCGEEFKAAFSCFIFSTEEPKGMDCVENFKGMQTCFRQYPEIYGSELDTDEEDDVTADDVQAEAAISTESAGPEPSKADAQRQADRAEIAATIPSKATSQEESGLVKADELKQPDHSLVPESYRPSEGSMTDKAKVATEQVEQDHEPTHEPEGNVPKAAFDATGANAEKK